MCVSLCVCVCHVQAIAIIPNFVLNQISQQQQRRRRRRQLKRQRRLLRSLTFLLPA